jgi:L-iditol 2-dehydrogenase
VLVLGGGTIGLLSGLLARDRGVEVAISVRYSHQRRTAQDLGLTAIDEDQVGLWASENKPDVVIETVGGDGGSLQQAVELCRPSGRIVIIGVFVQPPAIDALRVVVQEIEMIGSFIYGDGERGSDFGAAVSLLRRYRDEVARIQTHQFTLASISDAFVCANDKQNESIKVTVLP